VKPCWYFFFALAVFLLMTISASSAPAAPTHYVITDLGDMGGPQGSSGASAINNKGQIVGSFAKEEGDSPYWPFLWEQGRMRQIGPGQGVAQAINIKGDVVGVANNYHAFLYRGGRIIDLGTLGGERSEAKAINAAGQITGWSDEKSDSTSNFLWEQGRMRKFGDAKRINDRGDVAGSDGKGAFVIKNGQKRHLKSLPGYRTGEIRALNNNGEFVGDANAGDKPKSNGDIYDDAIPRAVLWRDGRMIDLCRANHIYKNGSASGINDLGQIVGSACSLKILDDEGNPVNHAVLWQGGKMYSLLGLVDNNAGWTLFDGTGINNRGQIVGTGEHHGKTHAFLLTPK